MQDASQFTSRFISGTEPSVSRRPPSGRVAALALIFPLLLAAGIGYAASDARSDAASPAVFRDCDTCPQMVRIPAGEFLMGAGPDEEERERLGETFRNRSVPQRRVRIAAFAMGRYEITRGEFRRFAEATSHAVSQCFVWSGSEHRLDNGTAWDRPGYPQDDRHPAICVSWEDAEAYVRWLSLLTGRRYRLPSEAEWEYAARAGTVTPRYWGMDGHAACAHANGADARLRAALAIAKDWDAADCDDGHVHTAPAGSFRANAFGLHDMLGNAAEWTADCWSPDYRGAPADGHSRSDGDCWLRAVRGGAWDEGPAGLRAGYRVGSPVVIRVYTRGFRVVRDE
ncbi:MAG: formylglycine-generating enzyme family protein [Burkholderiales bacterium]|nr:formylglycine-generating enzyme family protein [Burkholderiales bacterium]